MFILLPEYIYICVNKCNNCVESDAAVLSSGIKNLLASSGAYSLYRVTQSSWTDAGHHSFGIGVWLAVVFCLDGLEIRG